MAEGTQKQPKWSEIGRSTTTPTEKKERKEVKVDDYYVVVGFEVNNPKAFVANTIDLPYADPITVTYTQDLGVDYGHAFFYVVKNNIVSKVFSFGPIGIGKIGWFGAGGGDTEPSNKYNRGAILKDGYSNARPGTADYGISELVSAFKVKLSSKQGIGLEKETDRIRNKVSAGTLRYAAYTNDTCAEEARDILSNSGVDTPSGSGWVKYTGKINFPAAYVVNPYMWHHRFKENGSFPYRANQEFPVVNPANLIGSGDPLF